MSELSLDEFLESWKEIEIKESMRGFYTHLVAYIIVNALLAFINLWTSPGLIWFYWPLAGWGVGLAFHYAFSRQHHVAEEVEKKIAQIEYYARSKKRRQG
ncbi:MAG: 2TM domain-containing protein [Nitrososphaerota archaeon]|nr:2TM domain-containing protein [Candidatus Calditenuaceae archaeon]MDW8073460.1 2TM domain-containing protein [Nitrososphaerota archaeon]